LIWKKALVLARYLEKNHRKIELLKPDQRVIELGAGCGLLGIALAMLGCEVTLTDMKEMLELLAVNVNGNTLEAQHRPRVAELDWTEEDLSRFKPPFEFIVGTDVVFLESLVAPLIATLLALSDRRSQIFICVEQRNESAHELFLEKAKEHFTVKKIPTSKLDPEFQSGFTILLSLKRK